MSQRWLPTIRTPSCCWPGSLLCPSHVHAEELTPDDKFTLRIGSTFEQTQDWRKTDPKQVPSAGLTVSVRMGAVQACTNLGEMEKAVTEISQLERSCGVITTIINLHNAL